MAKTKEELKALKNECEALNNKLKELSEDELEIVAGGENSNSGIPIGCSKCGYIIKYCTDITCLGQVIDWLNKSQDCPNCHSRNWRSY